MPKQRSSHPQTENAIYLKHGGSDYLKQEGDQQQVASTRLIGTLTQKPIHKLINTYPYTETHKHKHIIYIYTTHLYVCKHTPHISILTCSYFIHILLAPPKHLPIKLHQPLWNRIWLSNIVVQNECTFGVNGFQLKYKLIIIIIVIVIGNY